MKWTKLDNFKGFNFEIQMTQVIEDNAKQATEKLKVARQWKRNRKTRQYNNGWEYKMYDSNSQSVSALVKNEKDWQLTWLLEHGHLIVNKKGGVGYASAHQHIKPVFDKQSKQFIKDMKDVKIISK